MAQPVLGRMFTHRADLLGGRGREKGRRLGEGGMGGREGKGRGGEGGVGWEGERIPHPSDAASLSTLRTKAGERRFHFSQTLEPSARSAPAAGTQASSTGARDLSVHLCRGPPASCSAPGSQPHPHPPPCVSGLTPSPEDCHASPPPLTPGEPCP